jgi:WD40 repeat protein
MTAAKVWQIILGAACIMRLLLPQGGAVSQASIDDIYSIAWRPDGSQFATGHAMGTVRLWDATTGELLNTFQFPDLDSGLPPPIQAIDWRPDGTMIAVAAIRTLFPGGFLWVLDATTGEILHDLYAGGMINDAAWSPDGTLLASAIIRNLGGPDELRKYEVNVWDVATEQLIAELEADSVIFTVAWSPDGNRLASTGWAQTTVWDTQTWTPLVQMGEPSYMPTTFRVAWSPDGTRVVTPGSDGLAYIWDATTGSLLMTLASGNEEQLHQIEWQPGGDLLVGRTDHALIYWDATSGQQVDRKDTSEWIGYVAWSPDGSQLLYSDHSVEYPHFAQLPNFPPP